MSLKVNLRHLEKKGLRLLGEEPVSAFDVDGVDELIQMTEPVRFDLWIEKLKLSVLVRGQLRFNLHCQCARCLARFEREVEISDWTSNLLLEGEEKVTIEEDCVDLTPIIREDILLAFPRQPLCKTECSGLPFASQKYQNASEVNAGSIVSSAWAELDKLKL